MTLQISATPDTRVLLFALAVSVAPALVFGLLPALQATRPDLVPALREATPGSGARSVRLRSLFVAGQLAMAVLLLVTAGLFVRSLQHGLQVDTGFATDGIVVAGMSVTPLGYDEERGRAFYRELIDRVRRERGVESVTLAHRVLLAGDSYGTTMRPAEAPRDRPGVGVRVNVVDTAYFATLRMQLLAGRGFSASDGRGAAEVVVVNQALASRAWPGENPIGRTLLEGDRQLLVVGLLPDGKYVDITEPLRPFVFLPWEQRYSGTAALHVRTSAPPGVEIERIRAAVRSLDPDVALGFAAPLKTLTGVTLMPQRFAARLIGALGILGLLLAGIGIYGVLSYHVAQRAHEFGVRMALGASAGHVARSVIGRAMRITAAGVALGLLGAWFVSRLLAGFIFGISVRDPLTFTAVPLLLAGLALLASAWPALRACRADPSRALRAD
jgi:predicted permease